MIAGTAPGHRPALAPRSVSRLAGWLSGSGTGPSARSATVRYVRGRSIYSLETDLECSVTTSSRALRCATDHYTSSPTVTFPFRTNTYLYVPSPAIPSHPQLGWQNQSINSQPPPHLQESNHRKTHLVSLTLVQAPTKQPANVDSADDLTWPVFDPSYPLFPFFE